MRVFAALAVLTMMSCASTKTQKVSNPAPAAKQSDLAGAPFTLSAITVKGKEVPLPATRRPTMQFTETDRVSGMAGINRYSGGVSLSATGGVTFGPMIATKMAGPSDAMELEAGFLDALSTVTRMEYQAGKLKLATADGATRLARVRSGHPRTCPSTSSPSPN